MKNTRTFFASALLLAAVSVSAQAEDRPLVRATVPFAFTVENGTLPAGTYTVSVLPPYNTIKIQSLDFRNTAMVPASPSTSGEARGSKLVFQRIGSRYFLTQVWEQGSAVHRNLRKGSLARELAKAGESVESTTIFAGSGSR